MVQAGRSQLKTGATTKKRSTKHGCRNTASIVMNNDEEHSDPLVGILEQKIRQVSATIRHNDIALEETIRHNKAIEEETYRHNIVVEDIARRKAGLPSVYDDEHDVKMKHVTYFYDLKKMGMSDEVIRSNFPQLTFLLPATTSGDSWASSDAELEKS